MGRFVGEIGYGETVEIAPGVWDDAIVEKRYMGDVMWDNRGFVQGDEIAQDLKLNNAFSVVADAYANENFMNIRYLRWAGKEWTVSSVEVQPPRLRIYIGGIYNGPTAN